MPKLKQYVGLDVSLDNSKQDQPGGQPKLDAAE